MPTEVRALASSHGWEPQYPVLPEIQDSFIVRAFWSCGSRAPSGGLRITCYGGVGAGSIATLSLERRLALRGVQGQHRDQPCTGLREIPLIDQAMIEASYVVLVMSQHLWLDQSPGDGTKVPYVRLCTYLVYKLNEAQRYLQVAGNFPASQRACRLDTGI